MRPFSLPFSIGTDICHVPRIQRLITPSNGSRTKPASFIRRLLTNEEQSAYRARLDNVKVESVARFLAGRWAAKEAVVKAHTWRRLTFGEIEILPAMNGAVAMEAASMPPRAIVKAELGSGNSRGHVVGDGDVEVKISISHDGEYAIAMCIAAVQDVGEHGAGGVGAGKSAGWAKYERCEN